MGLLVDCAPSRWAEFLSIPDDATITGTGEDVDLFVGQNKSVTLTISNEAEVKFRDIVVLGHINFQPSDLDNKAVKPTIIARDVFIVNGMNIKAVNFKCRNVNIVQNLESFREELQERFLEWMNFQRESVNRIGLKSVLV